MSGERRIACVSVMALLACAGVGCVVTKTANQPREQTPLRRVSVASVPAKRQGAGLQTFIENARCYASLPRFAHQPDFRIVPVQDRLRRNTFFWIMDGKQKIGVLNLSFGEIEMLRFFPPAAGAPVDYDMPATYHWSTLRGARLTIVPQGTWSNRGTMEWNTDDGGGTLHLRYTEAFQGNTRMTHTFTLRFDPVLGYVLDCDFEMQQDSPARFEYANLLPGHVADSRDASKRYQKCIWTRQDGEVCFMYQNPLSMMHAAGAAWAEMPDGGFLGFVTERDMNPFVEILQSTPGTAMVTCSVWYDQHFFGLPPREKAADGLYHMGATYRLLSLPLPLAKELEDAAGTMLPADRNAGTIGFRQGIINDFETPVPADTLYNGCIWGHGASWDRSIGHSGTHSIRIRGGAEAQPKHGGTPIHVASSTRYRFSAWVRTRGVTGPGAHLRIRELFVNWNDVRRTHESAFLTGDTEWTRLEITFTPIAGDPFVLPGLVVDGGGDAWFDDLELVEVPR